MTAKLHSVPSRAQSNQSCVSMPAPHDEWTWNNIIYLDSQAALKAISTPCIYDNEVRLTVAATAVRGQSLDLGLTFSPSPESELKNNVIVILGAVLEWV